MKTHLYAFALSCGLATTAQAQMAPEFAVGAGFSTLGATVEFSSRLTEQFGLRVPVGYGSFSRGETVDGTPLDGDLRLGGVALLGDYYPGFGPMRVSAGLFLSNYRATGDASGTITVQGNVYSGAVHADVRPERDISPMLALGFETGRGGPGWSLSGDAGAIFVGGFRTRVSGWQNGGPAFQPAFEEDLAGLRQSIEDDVSDWNVLPYLKLAVTYRF
ncbi:hypothetical protein ACFQXB_11730 [Plastorhodobacter daqingensis]|uniref:Outer membrane protein beta-barrel domain-containing protein n=1 Tax=Plastorhodobacter daqingensis TaxID=1387281 RepID=A0ABW2ULN5_9RHOB